MPHDLNPAALSAARAAGEATYMAATDDRESLPQAIEAAIGAYLEALDSVGFRIVPEGPPVDVSVERQVVLAAESLDAAQRRNPQWLWYSEGDVTFGRWQDHPEQAPYIRADLIHRLTNRSCIQKGEPRP